MKDLLKFITCGSVDDGKSTLIGHILYDSKLLYTDQKEALILDSKVGSRGGEIDYSLLLDGLSEEREQGITIDVAYRYFTTEKRSFIVADTPGHEQYTRNMAVGASFASLALILVDASRGVLVQTRRHARICRLMGINYFIFAVNKMDLIEYDEDRYKKIVSEINSLAAELSLKNVKIIPLSATEGDNVTKKGENMPWYDGETVLSALENVDIDSQPEQGFYLPVQRVCRPDHTFRGFQGEIESGTLKRNDEINVLPGGERAKVKQIFTGSTQLDRAEKGQPVTITLDREIDISRGSVLYSGTTLENADSIKATLLWMDDEPLFQGREYLIKTGTTKIGGRVKSILYKTDVNTGRKINSQIVEKNEIASCEIRLDKPIPLDLFKNHKTLGELILIDRVSNMTSACGVIDEITDSAEEEDYSVFEADGLKAKTLLFDEFFYNEKNLGVDNYSNEHKIFKKGDLIPLKGESYHYPENFDVLCVEGAAAVLIRDGRLSGVLQLEKYGYTGLPLVNGNGFSIDVHSKKDYEDFSGDRKVLEKQKLYEKWMRFETFRKIIFTPNYWSR